MVCHADNIFLEKDFNNIDLDRSFLFINGEKKLKAFAYIQEDNGLITGAVEKPKKLYSNLVVSGLFYFLNSEKVLSLKASRGLGSTIRYSSFIYNCELK